MAVKVEQAGTHSLEKPINHTNMEYVILSVIVFTGIVTLIGTIDMIRQLINQK